MAKEKNEKNEFIDEPDEFLELDEHADEHSEHTTKINAGQQEADVYTEEGREELLESEELQPWEEGFAKGAAPDKHTGKKKKAQPPQSPPRGEESRVRLCAAQREQIPWPEEASFYRFQYLR